MKKTFLNILKVLLSLSAGVFIIWWFSRKFTPEQWQQQKDAFLNANYFWVGISALCGLFSHLVRAWRWRLLYEPLGYKPAYTSSFYAVMYMYFFNLLFPRLGEVMRCTYMSKAEDIPFEKSIGTMLTERLTDTICLLTIGGFAFAIQFGMFSNYLSNEIVPELLKRLSPANIGIALASIVLCAVGLWFVFRSRGKLMGGIKQRILGFKDGLLSIRYVKRKWEFAVSTALIWLLYVLIMYCGFFSLEQTTDLGMKACLAAFFFGSIGIIVVQGGLGAYPVAIALCLSFYGIPENIGQAYGWLMWAAQNIVIVALGFVSLLMFWRVKRKQV